MFTLGIETSCDETSVALLDESGAVHCNLIASQIERHRPFGGVVPEIASREHLQHLFPLLEESLRTSGASWSDIDNVAVTASPGLIGALLVGVAGAQGLAYGLGIPLVAVNHLEGHIFSPYLNVAGPARPIPERFLALVISGGHSSIYDVRRPVGQGVTVTMLNRTRDDAIGETFDKVAKFIGLPYPGGPQIERLARGGQPDPSRFRFPIPQFKEASTDFSYSGIKASAIRMAREHRIAAPAEEGSDAARDLAAFCASFQAALFDQLFDRLESVWGALEREGKPMPAEIAIAGGVAANGMLRERVAAWGAGRGVIVRLPEKRYCTDNAAMIAFAGMQKPETRSDPRRVEARSRAR